MSGRQKYALVIGANDEGFSRAVVTELTWAGYEVITMSRRPSKRAGKHFVCDVSNKPQYLETLGYVRNAIRCPSEDGPRLDLVFCNVGYHCVKPGQTETEWSRAAEIDQMNFRYAEQAFEAFAGNGWLTNSRFITIGSRLAFMRVDGPLYLYASAKRSMYAMTLNLSAQLPDPLTAVHYIVPPMRTKAALELQPAGERKEPLITRDDVYADWQNVVRESNALDHATADELKGFMHCNLREWEQISARGYDIRHILADPDLMGKQIISHALMMTPDKPSAWRVDRKGCIVCHSERYAFNRTAEHEILKYSGGTGKVMVSWTEF